MAEPREPDEETETHDGDGNALCYGCLSEVVDQHGTLCDLCEDEGDYRV